MKARLFTIPASHPGWTARLMLERKGIPYSRIDLVAVLSKPILRAAGFPGVTVPALRIDGRRIQGSREIARELDRIAPEPPLFPADPDARAKVEEAEAWGDEVLQDVARRLVWNLLSKDSGSIESYLEGARLGLPVPVAAKTAPPIAKLSARFNKADDAHAIADLAALPGLLDRIDGYVADGVIGGAEPNAADLQIAPSVALLMTLDDLRPAHRGRARRASSRGGSSRTSRATRRPASRPPGSSRSAAEARSAPNGSTRSRVPELVEAVAAAGSRPAASARDRARAAESSTNRREVTSRCGSRQPVGLELEVAEQEDVDVDRPRAVARRREVATGLGLDLPCRRRAAPPARDRS